MTVFQSQNKTLINKHFSFFQNVSVVENQILNSNITDLFVVRQHILDSGHRCSVSIFFSQMLCIQIIFDLFECTRKCLFMELKVLKHVLVWANRRNKFNLTTFNDLVKLCNLSDKEAITRHLV